MSMKSSHRSMTARRSINDLVVSSPLCPGAPAPTRSPTLPLLLGLVITLAAVVAYSWYITRQIAGLRQLQSGLTDRNRKDSLQLLRIQNDLNSVGLAMRDMLDGGQPYPLSAWSAQFQRLRADLDDAVRRESQVAPVTRTADQQQFLASSFQQFWSAVDEMLGAGARGEGCRGPRSDPGVAPGASGRTRHVRSRGCSSRTTRRKNRPRSASPPSTTAFSETSTGSLTATLVAIVLTSAYLIRANRRLFAELASLSEQRHELAQKLIATREATLRHIARELHDEFGQMLTAMGSMLERARNHAPEGSPLKDRSA